MAPSHQRTKHEKNVYAFTEIEMAFVLYEPGRLQLADSPKTFNPNPTVRSAKRIDSTFKINRIRLDRLSEFLPRPTQSSDRPHFQNGCALAFHFFSYFFFYFSDGSDKTKTTVSNFGHFAGNEMLEIVMLQNFSLIRPCHFGDVASNGTRMAFVRFVAVDDDGGSDMRTIN